MTDSVHQELKALLHEGVSGATEREQTAFDRLAEPFQDSLVLFGARRMGRKVLEGLRKAGIAPLAFSDNDAALWHTAIDGIPVLPPAEAAALFGRAAVFVITIWGQGSSDTMASRESQLRGLGCQRVAPFLPLFWKYAGVFLPDYMMALPHHVQAEAASIEAAMAVLADDRSRRELLAQVRWRLLGDFDALTDPVAEPIYFPASLFELIPGEVFVDCGAYDGDTLSAFLARSGGGFRKIVVFEPDPHNLARLRAAVSSLPDAVRSRIRIEEAAVGSRKGRLSFLGTGTDTAGPGDGGTLVDCVTLDEALAGETPTFIKMDIEGAEPEALAGARRTVAEHAPVLAVCAYHAQNHCWRIPLLVHGMNPEYRIFLRPHIRLVEDLVCYAIPPARARA